MRLEGATQRTNDDSSHCSSLYHYHPLSTFSFQSSHMCCVSLPCTRSRARRGGEEKKKSERESEFVSCDMIRACRRLKLRAANKHSKRNIMHGIFIMRRLFYYIYFFLPECECQFASPFLTCLSSHSIKLILWRDVVKKGEINKESKLSSGFP